MQQSSEKNDSLNSRLEGILMAFVQGAAQRLGHLSAEELVKEIRGFGYQHQDEVAGALPPNPRAIKSYLEGRVFGAFSREQVESWALWRLSQMPESQGAALLESAAIAGKGDIRAIVFQLVKYFSG